MNIEVIKKIRKNSIAPKLSIQKTTSRFNRLASEILGLKTGDQVELGFPDGQPGELLCARKAGPKNENAFRLYAPKREANEDGYSSTQITSHSALLASGAKTGVYKYAGTEGRGKNRWHKFLLSESSQPSTPQSTRRKKRAKRQVAKKSD